MHGATVKIIISVHWSCSIPFPSLPASHSRKEAVQWWLRI